MDFKKILNKIKDVLIIIKDKFIIALKWLKEKILFCAIKIKDGCITLYKFLKKHISNLIKNIKQKIKNLKEKYKQKKSEKAANTKVSKNTKKSTAKADKKSDDKTTKKGKTAKSTKTSANKSVALKELKSTQKKQKKELTEEEKKEKRKKIIKIISAITGIIILILLLLGIRSCNASRAQNALDKERSALIQLVSKYADNGDYDNAIKYIDDFRLKHPEMMKDEELEDIWQKLMDLKKAKDNMERNGGNGGYAGGPVSLDTSGLTDALRNALADANRRADENQRAADENRRELQKVKDDLEKNKNNGNRNGIGSGFDDGFSNGNASGKTPEELEAERLKKEAEDKLAAENSDLKKKLNAINDEIAKGSNSLNSGKNNDGINHFDKASDIIKTLGGNTTVGPSKETEMAKYLYDAAQNASNPSDKDKLMKEAVKHAQEAVNKNPNEAAAHNIIAQDAINRKDYNTALRELQAAANVKGDPNRYLYYYNLGKVQYTLKKYSDAANSFTMSCELKNDFAPSRYNLGLTQKQLKNESAALDAFKKTIDIDPRHEKAFLEEARILAGRSDYLGAIEAYKNVLQINNVNVQAVMELGSVYYKRKNYQEAEDNYRRALTMLGPSEEMTLTKYNLSTVLYDAGKVDEAVKYAREAYDSKGYVKNNLSKANVIYNYGLVLDETGNLDTAIPVYKEVLSCNPDHAKTKINLGNMYMELNPPQIDTAMNLFLQVYQKDNNNFEANNNLGSAYLQKEEYRSAIKYFQNALRIQPKNNEVRANLARTYAKNGDYDNAKTTYKELIKTDKKNWDAYLELSKVCMQLNENTEAEGYLIYIRDNNPAFNRSEVTNLLNAIQVKD